MHYRLSCLSVVLLGCALTLPSLSGQGVPGLREATSADPAVVVVERARRAIDGSGLSLFTTIDHAANARSVGDSLPPTTVLLFGNPRGGTALMRCDRRVGIDLPLKMLIWEDGKGTTHIAVTDMHWLGARYGLSGCGPMIERIGSLLGNLLAAAQGG